MFPSFAFWTHVPDFILQQNTTNSKIKMRLIIQLAVKTKMHVQLKEVFFKNYVSFKLEFTQAHKVA